MSVAKKTEGKLAKTPPKKKNGPVELTDGGPNKYNGV